MNTKENFPTVGLGTVVWGSECILPAPVLGSVWQKGHGPIRHPDTRPQPPAQDANGPRLAPNGRPKGIPTKGRFEMQ